jgi:hypothetical protein
MTQDNVIDLQKPEVFVDDPITDILRPGARRLIITALAAGMQIVFTSIAPEHLSSNCGFK